MNTNTKKWSLTWNTTKDRSKLPHEKKLIKFFNQYCTEARFQYEVGELKGKEHIQGYFVLEGPRQSKKETLRMFSMIFGDHYGLTLKPVHDIVAIREYVTKEKGRVKGPYKAGKNCIFDTEMSKMPLKHWQKNLFDYLTSDRLPKLRDRKVIWVEDKTGNTGKSWFRKWLDVGQTKINVMPLPISSVTRLMSAVCEITQIEKVDVFTIDLTKTHGEEESFKDLFAAIEQIKNGYVVDVMFGKYKRAIFEPPVVIIFTNEELMDYHKFLSADRWLCLRIIDNELFERTDKRDVIVGERQKSDSDQLTANQSLDDFLFMDVEN